MSSSKPSIPKGTRDFGPSQSAKRNYMIEILRTNFKKYGFSQIETPAIENLSVLTGKYGDEGDQLLFKILNSGDYLKDVTNEDLINGSSKTLSKISEKGLRYDLTVPFARFVVQNRNDIHFPFKRFQIQPVWRADRPQRGRYREFYQCDADIIGSDSLWNEAELTLLIQDVFEGLDYTNITIKINHRQILNELAGFVGLAGKEMPFCVSIDKLDKVGVESVHKELLELGASEIALPELFKIFGSTASNQEKLNSLTRFIAEENQGLRDLKKYFDFLESSRRDQRMIDLDFSLARGLTYYTGMIFEVKSNDVKMGSICGGGRYDNLTSNFGLDGVSGVGISFGLDRIYDVLEEKELFPTNLNEKINVLICHLDDRGFKEGIKILQMLRSNGIKSEVYPEVSKLKKQMSYADKIQTPYVIIIGDSEIEKEIYPLKNMVSGNQEFFTIKELVKKFIH